MDVVKCSPYDIFIHIFFKEHKGLKNIVFLINGTLIHHYIKNVPVVDINQLISDFLYSVSIESLLSPFLIY